VPGKGCAPTHEGSRPCILHVLVPLVRHANDLVLAAGKLHVVHLQTDRDNRWRKGHILIPATQVSLPLRPEDEKFFTVNGTK
jgi:hypothetical protein